MHNTTQHILKLCHCCHDYQNQPVINNSYGISWHHNHISGRHTKLPRNGDNTTLSPITTTCQLFCHENSDAVPKHRKTDPNSSDHYNYSIQKRDLLVTGKNQIPGKSKWRSTNTTCPSWHEPQPNPAQYVTPLELHQTYGTKPHWKPKARPIHREDNGHTELFRQFKLLYKPVPS